MKPHACLASRPIIHEVNLWIDEMNLCSVNLFVICCKVIVVCGYTGCWLIAAVLPQEKILSYKPVKWNTVFLSPLFYSCSSLPLIVSSPSPFLTKAFYTVCDWHQLCQVSAGQAWPPAPTCSRLLSQCVTRINFPFSSEYWPTSLSQAEMYILDWLCPNRRVWKLGEHPDLPTHHQRVLHEF